MQGSLDAPPVIIRTSPTANLIGLVLCAIMIFFKVYLFGIGVIYFAWQLIDPSEIKIAPNGVTSKTSISAKHWDWGRVSNFRPLSFGQFGWDVDGKIHSVFGFGWEMSPKKISDLLNMARARWLNRP